MRALIFRSLYLALFLIDRAKTRGFLTAFLNIASLPKQVHELIGTKGIRRIEDLI
jgi:hypothetical protein